MQVRYLAQARADIDEIWDYSLQNWSIAKAHTYVETLRRACDQVADGRKPARKADAIMAGLWQVTQGRHVIYLRKEPKEIVIVRILHQSMNAKGRIGSRERNPLE